MTRKELQEEVKTLVELGDNIRPVDASRLRDLSDALQLIGDQLGRCPARIFVS